MSTRRQHPAERLDRGVARSGKVAEVNAQTDRLRRGLAPSERLDAAWVRTCRVYGIDPFDPPPMDRSRAAFRMGKLEDRRSD